MVYTRKEIEQKVNDIIAMRLNILLADVRPEAKLATDFDADSFAAVDITVAIEKEFDISISDDKIDAMVNATVADIYTMVEQYLTIKDNDND